MNVYGDLPDPLSSEEEKKASEQDLVRHNLRFALKKARSYESKIYDLDREDLQQIAALGLCEAAKRYKSHLGYRFSTYAVHRIRKEMQDAVRIESRYKRKQSRVLEFQEDHKSPCPSLFSQNKEMAHWVRRAVNSLEGRMREVVRMRVGMDPYERCHRFSEIGKRFGVSRQMAEHIYARAVDALRLAYQREAS